MGALSCSGGNNLGEAFWLPFSETAGYLGMNYLGDIHLIGNDDASEKLAAFIRKIEA